MRILLSHNFYRSTSPSGEDAAYRSERSLLERHLQVIPYERFNDDIDASSIGKKVRLALDVAWSNRTYEEISALIKQHRPDIAHFHNTFPQSSPSAYAACRENGVPVVQTLHNFRLICPGGLLMREGKPCEDCVDSNLFPALRYRCYRGSLPATGALVWMLVRNRLSGTYEQLVDRYIALTEFAASKMTLGGLPKDRISVKPNFLYETPSIGDGGGKFAVYVGRLSEEKGVRTLLLAWTYISQVPLKIYGDGPLREELEATALRAKLQVEFMGFCERSAVVNAIGKAVVQIIPSECYEGFPMVVVEAYACGTPVIASRIGSLDEIVEEGVTGVKFKPGDLKDLALKVRMLWDDPDRCQTLREGARKAYEQKYSAEQNFEALMSIYEMTQKAAMQKVR